MFIVKLTPYRAKLGEIFHRQTKEHSMMSLDGRYQFVIDDDLKEADFWVVQGKGIRKETMCRVAPENTIFLNTEPRSVLNYPQSYLRQFGLVSTSQYPTRHPNVRYAQAVLPWFVGFKEEKATGQCSFTLDYDDLKNHPFPKKKKLLSVISSNLAVSRGHLNRLKFVDKLKKRYGDQIDLYGRGFNGFDDKWDVLSQYKYHICIENCSEMYYWTEKIADCFLAGTYPFYYGCRNLSDYFPKSSFTPIDIAQADQAIEIIDRAINEDICDKASAVLEEAKNLVLDKYNLFEYVASLCDTLDSNRTKEDVVLKPCMSSMDIRNFFNYTFGRSYYKAEMKLYKMLNDTTL